MGRCMSTRRMATAALLLTVSLTHAHFFFNYTATT